MPPIITVPTGDCARLSISAASDYMQGKHNNNSQCQNRWNWYHKKANH